MSEVARLYRYKGLLSSRRTRSAAEIQAELEISAATFKRDLAKLRDQLRVPIVYDRALGGYRLEKSHPDSELPGLWFSPEEILALLTLQQLLTQLEPRMLAPTLKPLQERLTQLLAQHGLAHQDIAKKILVRPSTKRIVSPKVFEAVVQATMQGKRIQISHHNRHKGSTTQREISPLRIVYYRDNWYLDAWCHLRDQLRCFAIDAIESLRPLKTQTLEVHPKTLEAGMGRGYGIFSGQRLTWATLKFSPHRAQWVAREVWHPQQKTQLQADGSLVLSIPYADDRELVGDIMRFGPDVQVLSPRSLKTKVHATLLAAIARFLQ